MITRQRQKQILDAALSVFSNKGFGAATIPEIASEAGIAVGTIYNYYPSKQELLVAVIKDSIITEPLMELFKHPMSIDYPDFIAAVIENRLDFIQVDENRRLLFLMTELQRNPELKQLYIEQVLKPIFDRMAGFYNTRAASGYFRPLKAEVITRALGGMVMGLTILIGFEGKDSPLHHIPRDEIIDNVKELILYGVKAGVEGNK